MRKELEEKSEILRNIFAGRVDESRNDIHKEITDLIMNSLNKKSADFDDLDATRIAARLCANRRIFDNEITEAFAESLIKAVRELDESTGVTKECRIFWIRVLMATLETPYIRDAASGIKLSHLNSFYFHALEAEADEFPNQNLMVWYEEFIDKGMLYKYECRMFNRLAYFWLNTYYAADHADRARAYFRAMERRGINAENPYSGYYGRSNHEELIEALLKGDFDSVKGRYLNEYIAGLAKKIADGNVSDTDLVDFEQTMFEISWNIDITTWDQTLKVLCECLKRCCENYEAGRMSAEPADLIAKHLTQQDNWLLRYIELENAGGSDDDYYRSIEEWEQKIAGTLKGAAWVMLSSLREILIARYNDLGEKEKLTDMLLRHTADTDTAVHIIGDTTEMLGKRYCTHNTMALINLLFEQGKSESAEEIIDQIRADEKTVESACDSFDLDKLKSIWLKYIILLEQHGYIEEGERWREKLSNQLGISDDDIQCELNYLTGDYEGSLKHCTGNDSRKEMLEYITKGRLPEGINPAEIKVLENKSPDSIHCRGYIAGDEISREIQLTCREWHRFSADIDTLADMFTKGIRDSNSGSIYPADYYKTELYYDPETPIMRGDYIRHLYANGTRKSWLALTERDVAEIRKAFDEAEM